MTLAMHSPESRAKFLRSNVERMELALGPAQREAYTRWWAACLKQGIAVTYEARREWLMDAREDVTA